MTTKVSQKGQIVIPAKIRAKFNIKPGDKVVVEEVNNHILVVPIPEDPIKALRGILKGGPSLTKQLLADRREEERNEAQRIR
jgi:AbrB family looped-hinge helix DNA binding protein